MRKLLPDRDALLDQLAGVIYRVEANWDREGSGPGSRFEGELREHAQARGVVRELQHLGLLGAEYDPDDADDRPCTMLRGRCVRWGHFHRAEKADT